MKSNWKSDQFYFGRAPSKSVLGPKNSWESVEVCRVRCSPVAPTCGPTMVDYGHGMAELAHLKTNYSKNAVSLPALNHTSLFIGNPAPPSPPASTGNNSHFSLEASIQPTNCPELLQKKPAVGPFSRDTGHSTRVGMCLSLPSVGNKGAPVHSDWVSIWRRPGPPQHSSAGPGCPAHPALEFWRHPHYCLEYPLVCIGASAE